MNTGVINGLPATINVTTPGVTNPVSFPDSNDGVASTLSVETDGSGFGAVSHRVASICGSTSGRDHFPFPVPDYAVIGWSSGDFGRNEVFPFRWTPLQASRAYWLVKKWHVVIEYNDGGFVSLAFDFRFKKEPFGGSFSDYFLPTTESDLLLSDGQFTGGITSNGTGAVDGSYGMEITNVVNTGANMVMNLFFGIGGDISGNGLNWNAGIWPLIFLEIRFPFAETDDHRDTTDVGSLVVKVDNSGSLDSSTPISMSGSPISIANAEIKPLEYWPYATKAGLPVYDTTTGAQLRDPLS